MSPEYEKILARQAQERADYEFNFKRQHQRDVEDRAWRSTFAIRAASMFNVPVSEVTHAQWSVAYAATERDTMPR